MEDVLELGEVVGGDDGVGGEGSGVHLREEENGSIRTTDQRSENRTHLATDLLTQAVSIAVLFSSAVVVGTEDGIEVEKARKDGKERTSRGTGGA